MSKILELAKLAAAQRDRELIQVEQQKLAFAVRRVLGGSVTNDEFNAAHEFCGGSVIHASEPRVVGLELYLREGEKEFRFRFRHQSDQVQVWRWYEDEDEESGYGRGWEDVGCLADLGLLILESPQAFAA